MITLSGEDWLSLLDDEIPISDLKIPGTHNSTADDGIRKSFFGACGAFITQCQDLSLADQLKFGVRYVDIRLKLTKRGLAAFHGPCKCNHSFSEILAIFRGFLSSHSREFILVQVHREDSGSEKDKSVSDERFMAAFNQEIRVLEELIYNSDNDNPVIRECRGKIILLLFKHVENPQSLLNYRIIPVRKQWKSYTCKRTVVGISEKLAAIENGMQESLEHCGLYANECNAVGSVKLVQFIPEPRKMASEINPTVKTMLREREFKGALIFDFVDAELINSVVSLNFRLH